MLLIQAFTQRLAAYSAAFFVLKDDDFKGVAQRDLLFLERLRHLDGGERAYVAIVVAAHGNRVDRRADKQRLERGVAAGARTDDISSEVNMDIQARSLHQADGILAALEIGLGVGDTTHAALWVGAELRELFQMFMDALAVYTDRRRRLCCCRRKKRKQTDGEKS